VWRTENHACKPTIIAKTKRSGERRRRTTKEKNHKCSKDKEVWRTENHAFKPTIIAKTKRCGERRRRTRKEKNQKGEEPQM
jgi:hypothetical protein